MKEIAPGVTCERLFNDQIVAYTVTSVKVDSLSRWSSIALQTLETWPKDRPYLAIHDISRPGIGLLYVPAVQNDIFNIGVMPHSHAAISEILSANPDWQIALALIVSPSLSGRLAKLLFHQAVPNRVQTNAYFDRISALAWLAKIGGLKT